MSFDYSQVHWEGSPNFNVGRTYPISMIVIHDCEGTYRSSIDWLKLYSTQASCHYVLRSSDGDVTKMVLEANNSWHCGEETYNNKSVGIEHEGYLSNPTLWYTDVMLQKSAALVRDICLRWGIPIDRQHIIAHSEVRNTDGTYGGANHHPDPGVGWPWDRYMEMVRGGDIVNGYLVPIDFYRTYILDTNPLYHFGLPLENAINRQAENGYTYLSQTFEKIRMENHNGTVMFARIGAELLGENK